MRKARVSRIKIIVFSFTGIFLIVLTIYTYFSVRPEVPLSAINDARNALSGAGRSEASKYDAFSYYHANILWNSLLTEWKRQNELFILRRDYSNLIRISAEVIFYANKATVTAVNKKSAIQSAIEADKAILMNILESFHKVYNKLPLKLTVYNDFTRAGLLYAEGESAIARKEFLKAFELIREGKLLAEKCDAIISDTLSAYFENFTQWDKWARETIYRSKKNQNCAIIIDKFAQKCRVYNKGRLIHEFEAEFGLNWIGDKNHTGDKTTPEGKYFVSKRIEPDKTIYYKALLISYPNDEDKKRYNMSILNGSIPDNKGIGGLIEIHGEGGRGHNWTEGCIALENKDMDTLYRIAVSGTPVTILGSLRPIHELLNFEN